MRNKAKIHLFPRFHNLELLIAEFADQRFDAHWHDTWSVGVVLSGAHDNSAKGNGEGLVTTGQVTIIPPGEVHAGKVVGEKACTYLMLYPSHEVVRDVFEQNGAKIASVPSAGLRNRDLATALVSLAGTMTNEASSSFDCEVVWANCLDALTMAVAIVAPCNQKISQPSGSKSHLTRARDYLHSYPAEQIRLDELAHASGLSKFHLCRQFSAEFGLSPNRYQRQLRLQMARRLLREGMPIADVALACGFADQAHLGRQFRMSYGVTPGSLGIGHN
jgi:AraC-like DNA-binding protein/quercetin dioxygenase-like cupin family protein